MKKYLLGVSALLLAVVFSSFTMFAPENFRYLLSNESEVAFEDPISWNPSGTTHSSCSGGSDVCIIAIDDAILDDFPGTTRVDKLVNFLIAQNGEGDEFADATAAANALAIAQKP